MRGIKTISPPTEQPLLTPDSDPAGREGGGPQATPQLHVPGRGPGRPNTYQLYHDTQFGSNFFLLLELDSWFASIYKTYATNTEFF